MHAKPSRVRDNWDAIAVLLLLLATLPPEIFSSRTLVLVSHPNLLDDSDILDTSFKASRAVVFGSDVAYTYGPLFQWLSSAPSRWLGLSMGSIYATWYLLPMWGTFVLGWLTVRFLLSEQPPWKRFLLFLLLAIFWSPYDLRISLAVFLFAAFLRGWDAVEQRSLDPYVLGCGAAMLCAVAFLYSADSGVYALVALLMSLVAAIWDSERNSSDGYPLAVGLLTFLAAFTVLVLVIKVVLCDPPNFHFWTNSLAIVSAYRWIEPAMMTTASKVCLLAALIVGAAIFLLRYAIHELGNGDSLAARPGFLVGAFFFAGFTLQAGLVRSDSGHITMAIFPIVCFIGVILFSFESRNVIRSAVLAAVLCSILFINPGAIFQPSNLRYRFAQFSHPLTECPAGFREVDRACFPAEFAGMLESTAGYLRQHARAIDDITVFPYQRIFGIASGRTVAGGIMASYLVSGPYLSHVDIAGLERATAPAGVYAPDNPMDKASASDLSLPCDGVPSFTRSPEVWLWLFHHYRSQEQIVPGVVGLLQDYSRATRITMQSEPLNLTAQDYPIRKRSSVFDLGTPAWPNSGVDFLRLRLTVRYGLSWRLRKPSRLQLEITRADGSHDLRSFIVEPNAESEVWFYPWSEPDLARYFDADESHWRTGARPAITKLRLWVTPLDWVSVEPDSVTVQSAEAVRFGLVPVRTLSLHRAR
ncbi:MAG: hypothetical protein P4M04_14025 [Acidobacteriota bacterium]|nr:hypothetical protein [Acidobacteriota bacterium]